ncbi:MAG: hypothetical protein NWQ54_22155 [Paraglaciecola sp.]|nr:hypothetical protein [Paraglaciecola sp.]
MLEGRLIFFHQSIGIGGAQLLLARLAKYMHENSVNVCYMCPDNGFLKKYLSDVNCIEHINSNELNSQKFSDSDIIVSPLSYIKQVQKLKIINENVKLFFWDMHPYNYIENLTLSYFHKKNSKLSMLFKMIESSLIKKYAQNLSFLQHKNAVSFMCRKNYTYNMDFFGVDIPANYLPICLEIPNYNSAKVKAHKTDGISIGWLSRLDHDKVILLNNFIQALEKSTITSAAQFRLFIIGSGDSINLVTKTTDVAVTFTGALSGIELDHFISENLDCGFSVGTSALEFAKLSIPTFLVPGNDAYIDYNNTNNKYLPLDKLSGYDVAVENYHRDITVDLDTCFTLVLENYSSLAIQSYEYVSMNHSIIHTAGLLKRYAENSSFNISHLNKLYTESAVEIFFNRIKQFAKKLFA